MLIDDHANQDWQYFGTDFWLKGNETSYWPDKLTSEHIGGSNCTGSRGLSNVGCIAYGLSNLLTFCGYDKSLRGFQILTPESAFPRTLEGTRRLNTSIAESWSISPHAATALFQSHLWYDTEWYPTDDYPSGSRYGKVHSKASAVRTVCTRSMETYKNATMNVRLPLLFPYDMWSQEMDENGPLRAVPLEKPLWGHSQSSLTNITNFTTVWIPTTSDMGSVTTGLVILASHNSSSPGERRGIACSIDARWHETKHRSAELTLSELGSSFTFTVQAEKHAERLGLKHLTLPINDGSWTAISADQSWLEALTPLVPARSDNSMDTQVSDSKTTAITNLFLAAGVNWSKTAISPKRASLNIQTIEWIVSTAVSDAIARVGLPQQYYSRNYYIDHGKECSRISRWLSNSGGASGGFWCPGPPPDSNYTRLKFSGYMTGQSILSTNEAWTNGHMY